MERKAFLDQEPPPGYVAGVGRGASGFTTSADNAPMKFESEFGSEVDGENAVGILALSAFSAEDEEADRIYEQIDKRLLSRRRKASEEETRSLEVEIPTGTGVIQHLFTDLKSDLGKVTMDEWENLPLVGDLTRKNKRQRLLEQQLQRSYAAPDALIASSRSGGAGSTQLGADESSVKLSDIEEWESQHANLGDVDKGRQILASLRRTQPYKADSWISSARLEELANNWALAKKYIQQGCNAVPQDELIWLESIRLHRSEGTKKCKSLMNEALRLNSKSEKLWLAAVSLENPADKFSQRKVLMKALEFLPSNPALWKALIKIEDEEQDKRQLLLKATELCPTEWDLWLGAINIAAYSEAKVLLNKARKQLPLEMKVWTTALKLEERENPEVPLQKLSAMLTKGSAELSRNSTNISTAMWLEEAVLAQSEDFSKTAQAMVTLAMELVPEVSEMEGYAVQYSSHEKISSFIRLYIAQKYPGEQANWRSLFLLLKSTDRSQLYETYEKALLLCPNLEIFYLMYAKDQWILEGDIASARKILKRALDQNYQSEEVWSAQLKLEVRNNSFEEALQISRDALKEIGDESPRMWFKHVHLLRFLHARKILLIDDELLKAVSEEAFNAHSTCEKIILQRSQVLIDLNDLKAAREALSVGTRVCSKSATIWIALSVVDTKLSAPARARSLLDTALLTIEDEPKLWEARVNLELDQQDMVTARQIMNKSLKLFPNSPELWILYLRLIPKMSHRKNGFLDALKKTDNSTDVLLSIGVFFWIDGKFAKAKAWFERSLNSDKENGDAWAWMYCFHSKHGTEKDTSALVSDLEKSFDTVRRGRTWLSVVKNPQNLDKSLDSCIKLVADKLLQTTV